MKRALESATTPSLSVSPSPTSTLPSTFNENSVKLAISCDVNRTILIEDVAANKTARDELCTIYATCVYGTLKEVGSGDEKTWKWTVDPAIKPAPVKPEHAVDHVSYYKYLNDYLYPFPNAEEFTRRGIALNDRAKFINDLKNTRRALLKKFIDPGHDGESFHTSFAESLRILTEESPDKFQLLPSFYESMAVLLGKEHDIAFHFRTFGEDIMKVQSEWNSFCEGLHPHYSNVKLNGRDGSLDKRLHSCNVGAFVRSGKESHQTYLIMGTVEQPRKIGTSIEEFYEHIPNTTIFAGLSSIDSFLQEQSRKGVTLAIRDYYPWWVANNEHFSAGKLFIATGKKTADRIPQLFIDDNIRISDYQHNGKLIVDPRHPDGSSLDVPSLIGKHLVQAHALEAIHDKSYFTKIITKALTRLGNGETKAVVVED